MNPIKHLSIRNKLIVISIVPLVALFFYLVNSIWTEVEEKNQIDKVYQHAFVIEKVSDVIHELQLERGLAFRFAAYPGLYDQAELSDQWIRSDEVILAFKRSLEENESDMDPELLDQALLIRGSLGSGHNNADSIFQAYNGIIGRLIENVNHIADDTRSPEIKELMRNYLLLLHAREFLGRIRSQLNDHILNKSFQGNAIAELASTVGKHEINLEKYRRNISVEEARAFDRSMSNPMVSRAMQIIDSAYSNPTFTKFPYPASEWWTASVTYGNVLRELINDSALRIIDRSGTRLLQINKVIRNNVIIGSIILLVLFYLIFYVTRIIVSSVTELKNAADSISRGEVDTLVRLDSRDEIGDLAGSFNQLVGVSRNYAEVARLIGEGDYTPDIPIRGDKDILGRALHLMKENLKEFSEENRIRTWLLTGNAELNNRMRGEKEARELAREVINHLTAYMGAQIGAIYLAEGDQLILTGSYAFHYRKENSNVVRFGEGLVGQAALEKKPIVFSQVPRDYIKINSGLGSVVPQNILVYPFYYEDEVKGVIEVGYAREFKKTDEQLLDMAVENIGIAFHSAQSRDRLKDLLEETQRQAEELEAQQEELRQTNEELQEKTHLLEKSEVELKAQQEELQQTNEELEEKANLLEDQKERLEIAKMEVETKARELEITSKYKSEFLANMSHELRTPLNSILILAQLLSENKNKSLGEKETEFAHNIYTSGRDLLNLINEILDLSKVEAGKIELEISKLNIEDLTGHLHQMFDEVARNKAIRFDIHWDQKKNNMPLYTDKLRLEQIIRNLLSNAFKFTEKSGAIEVEFKIEAPNELIHNDRLRRQKEVFSVMVKDTGIGISADKQSLIFEAFQQADGSTKRKYGGTGLGLSISRELANALGGDILLQSEEGVGSVFTLYLPLKFDESYIQSLSKDLEVKMPQRMLELPDEEAHEGSEDIEDDRYSIEEKDKVILILEDDRSYANILLDFVRERGYKGILAFNGNAGLSLARHYHPDAIILDMKLPGMDGAEVLRKLKADPDLRHIPVQIISGYDRRKESLHLGAFDFLRKPATGQDLQGVFDRIEEFINKKLKNLLIVEDNKQQSKAIVELVGNHDVKSFMAYSGKEALEMIRTEKFDCIIVDLNLPDMSGFKLLEHMKQYPEMKHTPVIVYTGKDLSRQEAQKLEKLANSVVLKTAESTERLLDETTLFLHRIESQLPKNMQYMIRKLHRTDEVLQNKKVLIVDDDMRNIYSLTNALEEEGLRCISAENGIECIKVLKQNTDVDIVLMDVMMPEMDGFEATQAIRKMRKFQKLPIIALTAKAMKGDREKCLQVGMSDYISKPVNIEKLLSLMRVWLYK